MHSTLPFLWGVATSSHQIEGHNSLNDWWKWEQEGNIEGGTLSGQATDHWHRFEEDLDLAAALGLNSYRFSIEWSRIEPAEGVWDTAALDWYENLVRECEKRNLLPMLTLHHFTLPLWLAEKGGFASPTSVSYFERYMQKVHARLGSRIPLWCTINEPMVLTLGAYIGRFMPPAEYSPVKASQALANLLRSHCVAYDYIHRHTQNREGPFADYPLLVGVAQNMLHFLPDRSWHLLDQVLTQVLRRFYNKSFLDACTGRKQCFSIPAILPQPQIVTEALGRIRLDYVGVNYYTKAFIRWKPKSPSLGSPPEIPLGVTFARRKDLTSDLGWAVHPEGLVQVLKDVQAYGLPIYITENGIADRDDSRRSEFLRLHLNVIREQIKQGMDIRGYYHWSLLDNFEWVKGYGPRFGLYQVDYSTQKRSRRRSADRYRELIQNSCGDTQTICNRE